MMEREESNSLTDLTSNFRHEQFEGEMKLRLAVPFDAWGPIGRGRGRDGPALWQNPPGIARRAK